MKKKNDFCTDPYFYLNYKCTECKCEFGRRPNYCYSCGNEKFTRITPPKKQSF